MSFPDRSDLPAYVDYTDEPIRECSACNTDLEAFNECYETQTLEASDAACVKCCVKGTHPCASCIEWTTEDSSPSSQTARTLTPLASPPQDNAERVAFPVSSATHAAGITDVAATPQTTLSATSDSFEVERCASCPRDYPVSTLIAVHGIGKCCWSCVEAIREHDVA